MTRFKTLTVFLSVFALFALNSCDNDDDANPNSPILDQGTVTDVVNANGTLTTLRGALSKANGDLPGTLDGAGPFTLFAPSNAAFEALAKNVGVKATDKSSATEVMLAGLDVETLTEILTYHVVAGEVGVGELTAGKKLTTVQGDDLTVFITSKGAVQIQDFTELPETSTAATISNSNPAVTNGVVHFIDKVRLPDGFAEALKIDTRPSLLDYATNTPDLSTLAAAVKKTGLAGTIGDLKAGTVLAPNNKAFEDLLVALGPDYTSLDSFDNEVETDLLADILKYHVLTDSVSMAGPAKTALEDATVEVIADNGGFTDAAGATAAIVTADIDAKNGTAQIIDKVLLPEAALEFLDLLGSSDLATLVIRTDDLSILEEALIATELVTPFVDKTNESFVQGEDEKDDAFEKRSTPENFTYFKPATVFAPNNAAFEALFERLGADYTSIASFTSDDDKALLKEILLYHVVEGKIIGEDLSAGSTPTLAEGDIKIINPAGTDTFLIGDAEENVNANIVGADQGARNGVAHVIDKVLLPETALAFINSMKEQDGDK